MYTVCKGIGQDSPYTHITHCMYMCIHVHCTLVLTYHKLESFRVENIWCENIWRKRKVQRKRLGLEIHVMQKLNVSLLLKHKRTCLFVHKVKVIKKWRSCRLQDVFKATMYTKR